MLVDLTFGEDGQPSQTAEAGECEPPPAGASPGSGRAAMPLAAALPDLEMPTSTCPALSATAGRVAALAGLNVLMEACVPVVAAAPPKRSAVASGAEGVLLTIESLSAASSGVLLAIRAQ